MEGFFCRPYRINTSPLHICLQKSYAGFVNTRATEDPMRLVSGGQKDVTLSYGRSPEEVKVIY